DARIESEGLRPAPPAGSAVGEIYVLAVRRKGIMPLVAVVGERDRRPTRELPGVGDRHRVTHAGQESNDFPRVPVGPMRDDEDHGLLTMNRGVASTRH